MTGGLQTYKNQFNSASRKVINTAFGAKATRRSAPN
jgi:hypothetical protein